MLSIVRPTAGACNDEMRLPAPDDWQLENELRLLSDEREFYDRRLERFDQTPAPLRHGVRDGEFDRPPARNDALDLRLDLERRTLQDRERAAQRDLDRDGYGRTTGGTGSEPGASPLRRQVERLRRR
jgi:hypothetical protein